MVGRVIAIGYVHGCFAGRWLPSFAPSDRPQNDTLACWATPSTLASTAGASSKSSSPSKGRLPAHVSARQPRGNDAIGMPQSDSGWSSGSICGGAATLDSYGFGGGSPGRHPKAALAKPIERCRLYFETDTHLFVHANYLPDLPLKEQSGEVMRGRSLDDFVPGPHTSPARWWSWGTRRSRAERC